MKAYEQGQKIPGAGPEREALRTRGQFWTPGWVAEAMVAYVLAGDADSLFDPAVGAGAFFRAAKTIAHETGKQVRLLGTEIDPEALGQAERSGLAACDLAQVQLTDFVRQPPNGSFQAIVANPPYIRHHRLSTQIKADLKRLAMALLGCPLDGRAGLHVYFLLRALQLLAPNGRLAFIMPADTCEGVFAPTLWRWITQRYWLEAVVTFAPDASPFPGVDTNPLIFLIRNAQPAEQFWWVQCCQGATPALKMWMGSGLRAGQGTALVLCERRVDEAITTGLSRPPRQASADVLRLGDFARVVRGIATGANAFFFLTQAQARHLELPAEWLRPAIGRTRDVVEELITADTLCRLEREGRPTLLFCPDRRPMEQFPPAVQAYLRQGEAVGLAQKPLIATRRPWYKMETRPVPPLLFAYLGRRNVRFIRNCAEVLPLTVFLCVYPHNNEPGFIEKLWQLLQHPQTRANLGAVGKSYGAGAIKVEPRALEQLPLPDAVAASLGLKPGLQQARFFQDDL